MNSGKRLTRRGKFVQRYNITKATVDNYFIPGNNLSAFSLAKFKQDMSAHKVYGISIDMLTLFSSN